MSTNTLFEDMTQVIDTFEPLMDIIGDGESLEEYVEEGIYVNASQVLIDLTNDNTPPEVIDLTGEGDFYVQPNEIEDPEELLLCWTKPYTPRSTRLPRAATMRLRCSCDPYSLNACICGGWGTRVVDDGESAYEIVH